MVTSTRANRVALHRAVFASVALHIGIGALILFALKGQSEQKPTAPGINTRADVVMRLFDDGPSVAAQANEAVSPAIVAEPPAAPPPESGLRPRADLVPRTLPSEFLAVISRSVASRSVSSAPPAATALHGAMAPGKTVVYAIDCSGSMGEFDKLARAGAALLATLREQPESVRFQVVAYGSSARALIAGTQVLPATLANIEVAEAAILAQAATGRSNHADALRVAARFQPDFVVFLTDADAIALDQFKRVLAALEKPPYICLAKVSVSSVGAARELR